MDFGWGKTLVRNRYRIHPILCPNLFCQLPIARLLNNLGRIQALTIAILLWGVSFFCTWHISISPYPLVWAAIALGIMALGMVAYTPSAFGFVADLAPESLRGVYLSINSQCWAIGYFIGPALGGYALDQTAQFMKWVWLCGFSYFRDINITLPSKNK